VSARVRRHGWERAIADQVVADWFRRTGHPGDMERDAAYQVQWTTVRRMLDRLEEVLGNQGLDRALIRFILAAMLDDPPNAGAAEERMREHAEAVRELMERPPAVFIDAAADPDGYAAALALLAKKGATGEQR
jgi:hypothetical protein